MKCLLIVPNRYSIAGILKRGFEENAIETLIVDYDDFVFQPFNSFVKKTEALPNKLKRIWKGRYIKTINAGYLNLYNKLKPEIVFIYNNQFIEPEVLKYFSVKSKILFFLGDNPLYTPTSIYNLHILFFADYIICPNTFWIQQFENMGIKTAVFDCFATDHSKYFKYSPGREKMELFSSDLVYVGHAQKTNWGYKRFLFLNEFKDLNLKAFISGDGYQEKWKNIFPELEKRIITHNRYDSEFNNLVYNCSKICPVETVPSLFNGLHFRLFDSLGAGILPLCEYTKDLDIVFEGIEIPVIRSYGNAKETALYYINNDDERESMVSKMNNRVNMFYSADMVIKRALSVLFHHKL